MKNKNNYTVDEMLASWAAMDEALSCREETRIVPRRRLWRGYLTRHRRQCLLQLLRIVLTLAMLGVLGVLDGTVCTTGWACCPIWLRPACCSIP